MISELFPKILKENSAVLVVGLGVTGIETALFLHKCGAKVVGVERASREEYLEKVKISTRLGELEAAGIPTHFGVEGAAVTPFCEGASFAVLSPGVSLESAVVGALRQQKIKIMSELELGIELSAIPSIVVTGSNGKTTTVTLVHHILSSAGIKAHLVGNVGTPVVATLSAEEVRAGKSSAQWLVVEASSYQLESCETLKPKIAVFLNLSDNHLERHGSMQRYLEAKAKMLVHQDSSDFVLLNSDDKWAQQIASRQKGNVCLFGKEKVSVGADRSAVIDYLPSSKRDVITATLNGAREEYLLANGRLLGLHNRYDAAAAILATRLAGVPQAAVQAALESFVPLEHRIEPCAERDGKLFINDSKSTTVAATVAAVSAVREAYPHRKVVLLIGGRAKAGSWEPLMTLLKNQLPSLSRVVCFGGDGRILMSHCEAAELPVIRASKMSDAVRQGFEIAASGEVVLLSPGCASFDEFTDFEHRGAVFKELVRALPPPA